METNRFLKIFIPLFLILLYPLSGSANYYGEVSRFVETGVTENYIIGVTDKGAAFIYQKKSGELIEELDPKPFFLNAGVSENGEFAAIVYQEKGVNEIFADIVQTEKQKVVYHFKFAISRNDIDKVELSNDGRILLAMSDYVNIPNALYSTQDGTVLWAEKKTTSLSNALRPDGKQFIKTDYTALLGNEIRGDFSLQLFNIDRNKKSVSLVRKINLNRLKLEIRKRFGKIQSIITSHTFSTFNNNVLLMNFTFKKGDRYQYFIAKTDLTSGKVLSIMDYGLAEETSMHWNNSYKYENTLCELSESVVVAGYEGNIFVGDFDSNKLIKKFKRSITMANDTPPDIACFTKNHTFAYSDTKSENKNKPVIYLMKYKKGNVQPIVSKIGGKQLKAAQNEAKIAAEKARKEEEAERRAIAKAKEAKLKRISKSLNSRKEIGDFVCLAGKRGFFFLTYDVMLKGYVERSSRNKIQIRITDHGQNSNYNGVTLYRDTIIWDEYDSWYDCSLNN